MAILEAMASQQPKRGLFRMEVVRRPAACHIGILFPKIPSRWKTVDTLLLSDGAESGSRDAMALDPHLTPLAKGTSSPGI